MRFVTERRLAAARERLTRPGPRDDVTSVAVELGFGHVGRFAQLYRKTFGEARAGQTLSVTMKPSNASNYFNINPPGSDGDAMFIGSSQGAEATVMLPTQRRSLIRSWNALALPARAASADTAT